MYDLDQLALAALGKSFRELCGLGFSYDEWRTAGQTWPPSCTTRSSAHHRDHTAASSDSSARETYERIYETLTDITRPATRSLLASRALEVGRHGAAYPVGAVTHHYVGAPQARQAIIESSARSSSGLDLFHDGQVPLYTENDLRRTDQLLDAATRDPANGRW